MEFTSITPHLDWNTQTVDFLGHTYPLRSLIRMVLILFGYLLMRPYLLKLASAHQAADHAREMSASEQDSMAATGKKVHDSDDDGEDEGGWGRKERRRNKEAERRRKEEFLNAEGESEDEDDKQLNALLED